MVHIVMLYDARLFPMLFLFFSHFIVVLRQYIFVDLVGS